MGIAVVVDTNVLVSALWKRPSHPAQIVDLIALHRIQPCFNAQIITEYRDVLSRPRLGFHPYDIDNLMELIEKEGMSFLAQPSAIPFADESDRVFYDLAKAANAFLITGNVKHYPMEPFIMTPAILIAQLPIE
jgi:putative PIN family toxin of toxin-antitoxin system